MPRRSVGGDGDGLWNRASCRFSACFAGSCSPFRPECSDVDDALALPEADGATDAVAGDRSSLLLV